tara:strand:- start:155 stop:787 length:633 start_codon:yes stop_codon:yes gene_type:complete
MTLFTIEKKITELFQSDSPPQSIILKIHNEHVALVDKVPKNNSPIQDQFNSLTTHLPTDDGRTVLFFNPEDKTWTLLAWVPDLCPVRSKMLYSTSRTPIKKALGLNFFAQSDYFASLLSEITYTSYQASRTNQDEKCLNEKELFQVEEKLSNMSTSTQKTSAMGAVPFSLLPDAEAAIKAFASNRTNFVSLNLSGATEGKIGLSKGVDSR